MRIHTRALSEWLLSNFGQIRLAPIHEQDKQQAALWEEFRSHLQIFATDLVNAPQISANEVSDLGVHKVTKAIDRLVDNPMCPWEELLDMVQELLYGFLHDAMDGIRSYQRRRTPLAWLSHKIRPRKSVHESGEAIIGRPYAQEYGATHDTLADRKREAMALRSIARGYAAQATGVSEAERSRNYQHLMEAALSCYLPSLMRAAAEAAGCHVDEDGSGDYAAGTSKGRIKNLALLAIMLNRGAYNLVPKIAGRLREANLSTARDRTELKTWRKISGNTAGLDTLRDEGSHRFAALWAELHHAYHEIYGNEAEPLEAWIAAQGVSLEALRIESPSAQPIQPTQQTQTINPAIFQHGSDENAAHWERQRELASQQSENEVDPGKTFEATGKKVAAVFDLDDTLMISTEGALIKTIVNRYLKNAIARRLLRKKNIEPMPEAVIVETVYHMLHYGKATYRGYLAGFDETLLKRIIHDVFHSEVAPSILGKHGEMLEIIRIHAAYGHEIIFHSGTSQYFGKLVKEFILEKVPTAKITVISTNLETEGAEGAKRLTGRIIHPHNYGVQKAKRLREVMTEMGIDPKESYGYGNSGSTDFPFQELLRYKLGVNANRRYKKALRAAGGQSFELDDAESMGMWRHFIIDNERIRRQYSAPLPSPLNI